MSRDLRLRAIAVVTVLVLSALASTDAGAALVMRTISGSVTSVDGAFTIAPGATISGKVIYDDSLVDPSQTFSSVHLGVDAVPGSLLEFRFPGPTLTAHDDDLFAAGYPEIVFTHGELLGIGLEANGIEAFGSPQPLRFATGPGQFAFGIGQTALISGTYEASGPVALTPLPGALLTFSAGLAALVAVRRRTQ